MKKKIFNIAIVGLGNIGSYLFKFLNKNKNILVNKNNISFKISYVSAKNKSKKRKIKIKKNQWVSNYRDIIKKKDVDVIVELIGGADITNELHQNGQLLDILDKANEK